MSTAGELFTDVVRDVSGGNNKLPQSQFQPMGSLKVVDQGQDFVAGFTDDLAYQFRSAELPVVIFGDHTKAVKYIDFPFAMGADGVKVLKPSDKCDAKYLYHWLSQARIPDAGYSRHFKFVKELRLILPPLPEQRRIAAILDKADALRAKRRLAIAKLDQLLQSVFLEMFGDPVTNPKGWPVDTMLGDVSDICSGITKGRRTDAATTGVPYLAVANVQDRFLKLDTVKTIHATEAEVRRYALRENDLLLTEGGDPDKLGRGALWKNAIPNCIHQNHIFRVRLTSAAFDPVFLNWIVGSNRGKQYFLRSAKQTTGIASINMAQLKRFPLLRPPVATQQTFAQLVEEIERQKRAVSSAHKRVESLLAALQQQVFTAE